MDNIKTSIRLITQPNETIRDSLSYLNEYYPEFDKWYDNSFVESMEDQTGKILVAEDALGQLMGLALLKDTVDEKKIRCLRVDARYTGTGLGGRLVDASLEVLESMNPHATVCEEMMHLYSRLFVNRYGFSLDHVSKGTYREGKLEYLFNLK